jgi:hypothetical protein
MVWAFRFRIKDLRFRIYGIGRGFKVLASGSSVYGKLLQL